MVEEKRGGEEKVGKVQNMVNMAGKWDGGGQRLQADGQALYLGERLTY